MKAALLSVVAVAGLALSSGTASAQGRGYGHSHYSRGYSSRPVYVTPAYRPVYVAPVVTPYNAGLLDLSRNYGPNYRGGYVPPSGGFLGFSAGGGLANGYYGSGPLPNYGAFPGRRW